MVAALRLPPGDSDLDSAAFTGTHIHLGLVAGCMLRGFAVLLGIACFLPTAFAQESTTVVYGPAADSTCGGAFPPVSAGAGACASFRVTGGSWFTMDAQDALGGAMCFLVHSCSWTGSAQVCRFELGESPARFGVASGAVFTAIDARVYDCDGATPPTAGTVTLTTDGASA